jgi:hypothetical protein
MLAKVDVLSCGQRTELKLDRGNVGLCNEPGANVLRQQVKTDDRSGHDHRCDHDKPRFASHGCNHIVVALACQ